MDIHFILHSPARAANVGAAARALKTQGFSSLIVINSAAHLQEEARWVACGAEDVLANIRQATSLAALRAEFDLLIGTTARERGNPRQYLSPAALIETLTNQQHVVQRVGIVFGCEASGLSNADLALCDLLSYLPLAQEYPSLNLAQAVMLYAYELGQQLQTADKSLGLVDITADPAQLQALLAKADQLLTRLAVNDDQKLQRWLQETLARFGDRDVKMAHQLFKDILKQLP